MHELADGAEHPPTLPQPEPPRVAVHVDLHGISLDLQAIKAEIARRPARGEVLRLAPGCLAAVVVALMLIR
jgi:hypothetical protein